VGDLAGGGALVQPALAALHELEVLDGVGDGLEILIGTNPLNPDSDNDGLTDGEEGTLGTNPLDSDSDNDLLPDGAEVDAGTNPLDANSAPRITGITRTSTNFTVSIEAARSATYYAAWAVDGLADASDNCPLAANPGRMGELFRSAVACFARAVGSTPRLRER
jgi:hypothetical protein